ncbi:hypothetical protein G210_1046 [Candida maltosa Xu316]|uniref:Protein ROT1 n=1 Tax=Candida maltosa (strain Xu316) TaxID=1245528 RepID=M3J8G1_CANMX|nr:hypothetical protein G210_1046 [Candida maltosa Xu316]
MFFLLLCIFSTFIHAIQPPIEGTWQSQSGKVITGSQFFDPKKELLIEPTLPGISYTFTANGHWESAQYIITANNKNHSCPQAVLLWQHGRYVFKKGKLILRPIEYDGRQLISDPCLDNGISEYKGLSYGEEETADVVNAAEFDDVADRPCDFEKETIY